MADVEIRRISKRYDRAWALRQVSFAVPAGSFTSLLGPSGCGKTTTLRLIAGFIEPDEGEVRIGGNVVDALPPWRRNLGVVFQNYALFPFMTVEDNVAFGLRRRALGAPEISRRVGEALELVSLSGLERRYPRQLSGGQQQRVALARALVIRPDVLLLDEPLSNLDARLRAEMRFELKRIQRETGVTSIFVTHDQEEALTLSDRIVVLNRGTVRADGAPRTIWEKPENAFVADFLGMENLIPARVEGSNGASRFAVGDTIITAAERCEQKSGDNVVLGIRSGDIVMDSEALEGLANETVGEIREFTYLGASIAFQVQTPLHALPLIATGRRDYAAGAMVRLRLPEDRIKILKPDE